MPAPAPAETTTAASLDAFNASWDVFFASVRRARGRAQRTGDDPAELSLSQYHLLVGLMDEPKLPVGELALRAGVSGPTATRALDGLARRGLVRREPSPTDRRVIAIRLTSDGERALARKRAVILGKRAELFEELAPAEREQAQRLLRRLGELIDQW